MSKTKQVLELSSPSMKTKHERLTGLVQQCNYCCGNGWFWNRDGAYSSVPAAVMYSLMCLLLWVVVCITWKEWRAEA